MSVWEKLANDPIKLWVFVILMTIEAFALGFLIFAWIRDTKGQKNKTSKEEEFQNE